MFSWAALAVLGAAAWMAPTVLVLTRLRDRPLEAVFAGIDGGVSSRAATWNWLGRVEFRDVVLRDRAGKAAVMVPQLVVDRGLLGLALSPRDIGTVRLVAPEAVIEVRRGSSSLEDILAPWLAAPPAAALPSFDLEVLDATVEFVDAERGDAWRVTDVAGGCSVRAGGGEGGALAGWTVGGRVRPVGRGVPQPQPPPGAAPEARLDRTAIASRAAAAVAREGGFSVSAPEGLAGSGPRTVTIAAHRLPLGITSVLARRFDARHLADGLADVRLDVAFDDAGPRITGSLAVSDLAVCRSDSLAEVVVIERFDMPLDVSLERGEAVVRKLAVTSPAVRAEANGRIRMPAGDAWQWAEELARTDFSFAADIDLAATARALPGGITVRPDVRVTDGRLEVAATARADGDERVLEMRAAARDLAAVQQGKAGEAGERHLRWQEPFAAWLRGRLGTAHQARLHIEDARLTSAALELSAAGTAAETTVRWTLDIGKLAAEAAEVIDFGGATLAGTSRGRLDIDAARQFGPTVVAAAIDLADFEFTAPGRPAWRDKAVSLEAEAAGRVAAGAAVVERAHVTVAAADDRFEATLTGGVIVDLASIAAGVPAVRAAPGEPAAAGGSAPAAITADCSLAGDLQRWHARLAPFTPSLGDDTRLGGQIQAAAAVAARGDAWQITRAGGEIERFTLESPRRRFTEPRVVASGAGLYSPATGQVDVSSAEVLTATVSLRTGGISWLPRPSAAGAGWTAFADRLRGKVQWQADVGRTARWLLPPETVDRWPVSGRSWGTLELVDTQAGLNVLVEATGDQLALAAARPAASKSPSAPPRPLWQEPRVNLVVEVTRPFAATDAARLTIDGLRLESSTLAVAARGAIRTGTQRRLVELEGTASYDWEQISRLAQPWTGGRVRLAGSGGRPFALRVPLGGVLPEAGPPEPPAAGGVVDALPLPEEWLSATRGGGDADRAARIAVPVAHPAQPAAIDLLGDLSIDTSIAWQAGDVAGFPLAAGELPVRLLEGQLALGPFDFAAAGGRVRGAPWVRLRGSPRELVVPPGRIVDRVAVGGPEVRKLVSWLSPLVGHTTNTQGIVSLDLAGARLPIDDPFAGELAGQVVFDALEVTPGAGIQPLVNLIVKLQSAIDPRFAFGDQAVLMRVRPDPVRVRITQRRLWHEGLVMDAGQLTVKSGGSVGSDGSLAMAVEVAFRGDLAGQTPVIGQLLRTPLVIPLKGTVERPHFDAGAIDLVIGRIVENTAQAVINDGLGRGLEAIFGAPSPPPPAPLTLPPAR